MFSNLLRLTLLSALLLLASCARPQLAKPALWKVEGPNGQSAYLFGTIHALEQPADWRGERIEAALAQSDRLVLEVARIDDQAGMAAIFDELGRSAGLPSVAQRLPPDLRDDLERTLSEDHIPAATLDQFESWAAALVIQQAASQSANSDTANGIDRALLDGWNKPVEEFEGARAQLAIFDRLPEAAQRSLLGSALTDRAGQIAQLRRLEAAWVRGDMALIARETERDLASDPVLREALVTSRNQAWTARLKATLRSGAHPFVAVGAAHMAGSSGIPALLGREGFRVTRVQ